MKNYENGFVLITFLNMTTLDYTSGNCVIHNYVAV